MAGTSEGGRKAARTRGRESLQEAGRKGGKASQGARHQKNNNQKSQQQQ